MAKSIIQGGKKITVVSPDEREKFLSENDIEMDARAVEAVRAAIKKAEICKKPIAKYDTELEKAYLLYPDGSKEYAK